MWLSRSLQTATFQLHRWEMSHGRLWHTTRFRKVGSYSDQLERGLNTYFSITCNMLGQLMKLAISKSPAGQAVSDMVSVKRVSKSALQYSNTPRLKHNRHRLPFYPSFLSFQIATYGMPRYITLFNTETSIQSADVCSTPLKMTFVEGVFP